MGAWVSKLSCGFVMVALATGVSSAQAAPVSGQGTWEQTLQGRDLDGNVDNGFEAYYDTTQDLTWLADANWAVTSGASSTGLMIGQSLYGTFPGSPLEAAGFAAAANLHGVDDWTLPGLSLGDQIYEVVCQPGHATCDRIPTDRYEVLQDSSQLQHLLEVTLGNRSGNGTYVLENTGPFKNLQAGPYWSSEFKLTTLQFANSGWTFNTSTGRHLQQPAFTSTTSRGYAWLVRKGDVAAIPEPQAIGMWALGLMALVGAVSRRKAAALA
jgi:hypothetical protein